jgi:uncharacterized protein
MLIVLSPAKRIDPAADFDGLDATEPAFLDEAETLVKRMRRFSKADLAALMGVNDDIAELNRRRFKEWQRPFTAETAPPALLQFMGDVFQELKAREFSPREMQFAQRHLRILSGLYGVLRPLDRMVPYRLEMGSRVSTRGARDLYEFWGSRIAESLNTALASDRQRVLVNLASNEYFAAIDRDVLDARVVTPEFKQRTESGYKSQGMFGKRARGLMTRFAIVNGLVDPDDLKAFDLAGYAYVAEASTADEWVFARD